MRDTMNARSTEASQSLVAKYRYHLLGAVYVVVTGLAFARVHKQPYTQSIKMEQYETIFKGTTLATVIAGVAINGKINQSRSAEWRQAQETAGQKSVDEKS